MPLGGGPRESPKRGRWAGAWSAIFLFAAIACGVLQLAVSTPANAAMSVKEFQEYERSIGGTDSDKVTKLRFFLLGVLDAIEATQAAYVRAGAKPFICLPQNPRPRLSNVVLVINSEVGLNLSYWQTDPNKPIEPLILKGLMRTWPCK